MDYIQALECAMKKIDIGVQIWVVSGSPIFIINKEIWPIWELNGIS